MRILCGVMVAAGLMLSGCGKKSESGGSEKGGSNSKSNAAASGITGTWNLDIPHMKKAMFEEMKKQPGVPADITMDNPLVAPVLASFDNASFTVTVKADGTWSSVSKGPDGDTKNSSGTWKKAGDDYEFTTKIEDGQEADPKVGTVKLNGDTLTFTMEEAPFPVQFKRA